MDNLVWVDCEMTGLDLSVDALIEVAVLVTDGELNVLGEGVEVVIAPPPEALAAMGEFVTQMHQSSGLLDALEHGVSMSQAQDMVMEYVKEHVPEARKAPLAGNTIGTDRAFLARDMPEFEGYVHYRNVDVSSLKELAKRWYSRIYYLTPEKSGNHRALADIRESIEELRYYREAMFVEPPGPDKQALTEIAARQSGALSPQG